MKTPADLHITFDLNHENAILELPEGPPMKLNWPEFPEAFARYMNHLQYPVRDQDRKALRGIEVSSLKLTEKILDADAAAQLPGAN